MNEVYLYFVNKHLIVGRYCDFKDAEIKKKKNVKKKMLVTGNNINQQLSRTLIVFFPKVV